MAAIDKNVITSMIGDDINMQTMLIMKYLDVTSAVLSEFHDATKNQDIEQVSELMHKIKSSSRTVGAMEFGELCAQMEQAGIDKNWQFINDNKDKIHSLFIDIEEYIKMNF